MGLGCWSGLGWEPGVKARSRLGLGVCTAVRYAVEVHAEVDGEVVAAVRLESKEAHRMERDKWGGLGARWDAEGSVRGTAGNGAVGARGGIAEGWLLYERGSGGTAHFCSSTLLPTAFTPVSRMLVPW